MGSKGSSRVSREARGGLAVTPTSESSGQCDGQREHSFASADYAWIRGMIEANRYRVVEHARRRMRDRQTDHREALRVVLFALRAVFQSDSNRWRFEGCDSNGGRLVVIVECECDGVPVIVTVY